MRIYNYSTLKAFFAKHAECEKNLRNWYKFIEKQDFNNFNEVLNCPYKVSLLKNNRVCFNIKGNNYRLIVEFDFNFKVAVIRFIGTHAEYDSIDANTITI
ncbi:MAG: type II toxin-antitoxin system HigB family toxin [Salinivirgaceae bacterium]|nr:type II toxin-antitoxin system HigB family toxin [Salinivirgaceae bacterium]